MRESRELQNLRRGFPKLEFDGIGILGVKNDDWFTCAPCGNGGGVSFAEESTDPAVQMTVSSSQEDPAFCFMVVVWGERYRGYFAEYCLPSLLAPNNIPCIANKRDSRFAIATTAEDWTEISKLDLFKQLAEHIEPVFVEMPSVTGDTNKMLLMSKGHKRLSNYAFERKAFGININPDSIHSDHMIRHLQESAREGKKLVLFPGLRFEMEGILAELEGGNHLASGKPLSISPRKLARVALHNPHSFLKMCDWDSDTFFEYPVFHYIAGPNNDPMIIHTISMGPLMTDYSAIDSHDDDTFDKWTLDGDYAYSNFGHFDLLKEIEYIDDSDSFMIVSLTPKDEECVPLKPVPGTFFQRPFNKAKGLWRVYSDPVADPLKKRLYLRQVVFHGGPNGLRRALLSFRDKWILKTHVMTRIDDPDILLYAAKYGLTINVLYRLPHKMRAIAANFAERWRAVLEWTMSRHVPDMSSDSRTLLDRVPNHETQVGSGGHTLLRWLMNRQIPDISGKVRRALALLRHYRRVLWGAAQGDKTEINRIYGRIRRMTGR